MSKENRRPIHPNILFPGVLLLLEAIVVFVLLAFDYEIKPFLLVIFIMLGTYFIFQIIQHLAMERQVMRAVAQLDKADRLAESGTPLEAIRQWKKLLQHLPKTKYLDVLAKMEQIYNDQEMSDAVQQVKAIHSESLTYFEMTNRIEKVTPQDRQNWQTQVNKLGILIEALPVEKGQGHSEINPEE